eukprot:Skav225703  [mRNA]  locus=scaffold1817:310151:312056:+ [translate_table: standard]
MTSVSKVISVNSVTLSQTLEPQLLRAAPLTVALSGFCKHWEGLAATGSKPLVTLSRPVKRINVFLSHDWQTCRWLKLLTLLLYFNSSAAAIAALLSSLLLGVLKTQLGASMSNLWFYSCYLVFLIVLAFWQRIRNFFVSAPMVFLDKLCIYQENEELKQKGILGLGAFVGSSEELLVLWSRRTFTRLWCAYEIGCFLSRMRRMKQLEILPVAGVASLYLTALLWHLLVISYTAAMKHFCPPGSPQDLWSVICVWLVVTPIGLILLPPISYLKMTLMDDFDQLPQQLQDFQIQKCECFCCHNDHKHPLTGDPMICDRELVYEALSELYSRLGKDGQDLDPLQVFNSRVRERLRPQILQKVGCDVPKRYTASLVLVSMLPFLSQLIGIIGEGPQVSRFGYAAWLMRQILHLLQPCLALTFAVKFCQRLLTLRKMPLFRGRPICLSVCLSPVMGSCVGFVWASFDVTKVMSPEDSWLPLVPFLVAIVFNVVVYFF